MSMYGSELQVQSPDAAKNRVSSVGGALWPRRLHSEHLSKDLLVRIIERPIWRPVSPSHGTVSLSEKY